LEKAYTKQEILALYANTVPFGENVFGVEAASRRFFNKSITKIKPEEAAVLVGMLKANTYYNPRLHPENALKRRNVVLSQMEKYGYLTSRQRDSLSGLALTLDYANTESEGTANYFLVQIRSEATSILDDINKKEGTNYDLEKDGLIIQTTLDLDLQKQALKAFRSHLSVMQNKLDKQYRSGTSRETLNTLATRTLENLDLGGKKDQRKNRELFSWNGFYHDSITAKDSIRRSLTLLHAGLLALNPKTGAVKAWVGGIDFRTQPYDQILAQRQVASTFKPVLYATALENGVAPCSYLDNEPLILTDFDNWQPQNYDGSSGGKYSLAAALAKSMNIPTVNLYLQTPFEKLENMWKRLGFSQTLENKPSTALGTASASIYELALAYSAFANGGYHIEPKMIASVKTTDGKILYKSNLSGPRENDRVVSRETAELLTRILQKAIDEGTGTAMRNTFGITIPLAGKTGTSQDYVDAWFAAYTPKIVIVTRVGASFPSIRFNNGSDGSGSRLALPIVGRTLKYVQKKYGKDFETLTENDSIAFDCDDFVADSDFTKFFESIFSSNRTTLEKAQKKAERKAKREQRRALRQKNRQ
ncbi:MAG: transglycosylase domain-containing protein, partial [Flavobacteriaceae bacterium]|nr:transglycosylase domain-containing protein [Flavobacteriaceae bacterium]